MADADFGYVGGAPGKIDLYVGKEVVRRGIAMDGATDELIELIKVCCCCASSTGMLVVVMVDAPHRRMQQCLSYRCACSSTRP